MSDLLHEGGRKESKKQEIGNGMKWKYKKKKKKATNNVFAHFEFSSLPLDLFCENKKNVRTTAHCTFIVKNSLVS